MSNGRSHPAASSATLRSFEALRRELIEAFRAWERRPDPWDEERFDDYARRAFRVQFEHNPPYAAFCRRRGIRPDAVRRWTDIPAVPTAAFRTVPLALRGGGEPAIEFRTSGTSRGARERGRHAVLDPEIYRASLEAAFRHGVLDGGTAIRMLSLVPPFEVSGDSSLAWMCDALLRRFGADGSEHAASGEGLDLAAASRFARMAVEQGTPVCVLATTVAAEAWTRELASHGMALSLPTGSRLMDTGGTKGRAGLRRDDLVARVVERLGIPAALVINEFGMTELLSQRYSRPLESLPVPADAPAAEPRVTGGPATEPTPSLYAPPWLRSRALDPESLAPRPAGAPGVLCHFDLANLGSVCAVLTEDLGRTRGGALEYCGRASGAPPRGCSLATAELLAAVSEVR